VHACEHANNQQSFFDHARCLLNDLQGQYEEMPWRRKFCLDLLGGQVLPLRNMAELHRLFSDNV
jgi:hypothetical protein